MPTFVLAACVIAVSTSCDMQRCHEVIAAARPVKSTLALVHMLWKGSILNRTSQIVGRLMQPASCVARLPARVVVATTGVCVDAARFIVHPTQPRRQLRLPVRGAVQRAPMNSAKAQTSRLAARSVRVGRIDESSMQLRRRRVQCEAQSNCEPW